MASEKLKALVEAWPDQKSPDVNQSEIIAAKELLSRS